MKRFLKILSVGIVLFTSTQSLATDLPDFPFIVSSGVAYREVQPDIANLSINLLAFDEDAEVAIEKLSTAFEKCLEILSKYEVPIEAIKAADLRRSTTRAKNSDYQSLNILGYQVARTIMIELDGLSFYAELAEELATVSNLSNLDTSFDVSTRDQIEEELLVEASDNATRKAELMTEAFGQKIDSVYAISQSSDFDSFFATFGAASNSRYYLADPSASQPHQAGMAMFIPESIHVRQSINVVMRIDER